MRQSEPGLSRHAGRWTKQAIGWRTGPVTRPMTEQVSTGGAAEPDEQTAQPHLLLTFVR